jgi:hypothetical protein
MKISAIKLSLVAALVMALAMVGAASASADSTSCAAGGFIKLSPGLTNTPQIQTVTVKGTLAECASSESEMTGGKFVAHFKTAEPVSCAVLSSAGVGAGEESNIVLKPQPKDGGNPMGSFSLPITETAPQLLSGTITSEGEFAGNTIGGSVTETFVGGKHCGEVELNKKGKPSKVSKGTFVGTLAVS